MPEHDETLSPRAAGLVELARSSLGQLTEAQRVAGLRALRSRLPVYHRSQRVLGVALGGAVLVTGLAVLSWWRPWGDHGSRLALRVEGAQLAVDTVVEATGSAPRLLSFSDGSQVSLAEGGRLRVRSIDEHGARVLLEQGEAHVYVTHIQGARWNFDAGPFVVGVTGTAFTLSWREDAQRLDVRLEDGTVSVSGPMSDSTLSLRAGQWLTVQGGEVRIRSLGADDEGGGGTHDPGRPSPTAGLPSEASQDASPGLDPFEPDRPSRSAPRPTHDHAWAAELARGRPDAVIADALALGIDGVFAQATPDDLAALADAARYTHRTEVARGALLAQRRRFPGSDHARVAAFGLGRVEDADKNFRAALVWFDRYLDEAPNGRYASEALGRKMDLVKRLDGNAAARSWAELYLRRFPDGTYAAAARAVTESP
jgi:hypothetical protein